MYTLRAPELETTPLVSDGVMYVTSPGEVCALDSRSGRAIWCYTRSSSQGRRGRENVSQDPNRGVAILGDRVFFVTRGGNAYPYIGRGDVLDIFERLRHADLLGGDRRAAGDCAADDFAQFLLCRLGQLLLLLAQLALLLA